MQFASQQRNPLCIEHLMCHPAVHVRCDVQLPLLTFIRVCLQILKEDDANWPPPDKAGRQELEIILGGAHISFTTTKLGSVMQVQQSKDPDGLRIFYYLVQACPQHGPRDIHDKSIFALQLRSVSPCIQCVISESV